MLKRVNLLIVSSRNVFIFIQSRRVGWNKYVTDRQETKDSHKVAVKTAQSKENLDGKCTCKSERTIKICQTLTGINDKHLIKLISGTTQLRDHEFRHLSVSGPSIIILILKLLLLKLTKLRGLSPHANYTDRAAAAGRRS